MCKVLSIGDQVFTNQFTKKDQVMVTLSGGYDYILRREVKVNTFIDPMHVGAYPVGQEIPAAIVVLPIPQSFVGKDGTTVNLSSTNVLARIGEPYEAVMARVLAAKAFAAKSNGSVTAAPVVAPSAAELRLAELKAKTSLTKAEKVEYATLSAELSD